MKRAFVDLVFGSGRTLQKPATTFTQQCGYSSFGHARNIMAILARKEQEKKVKQQEDKKDCHPDRVNDEVSEVEIKFFDGPAVAGELTSTSLKGVGLRLLDITIPELHQKSNDDVLFYMEEDFLQQARFGVYPKQNLIVVGSQRLEHYDMASFFELDVLESVRGYILGRHGMKIENISCEEYYPRLGMSTRVDDIDPHLLLLDKAGFFGVEVRRFKTGHKIESSFLAEEMERLRGSFAAAVLQKEDDGRTL